MATNCVYKITNLTNQKAYIGSTNNYARRMREHRVFINCDPMRDGYNLPLYCAFRKYGLQNFKFEILIDNIDTLNHARQLEEQAIANYNSVVPNGYNIKSTTEGLDEQALQHLIEIHSMPCALITPEEQIITTYYSLREAERQLNITVESISAVCKGLQYSTKGKLFRFLDKNNEIIEIEPQYLQKGILPVCAINPFDLTEQYYYENIVTGAQAVNVTPNLISKCIQGETRYSIVKGFIWRYYLNNQIVENNLSIEQISKEQQEKHILYNNERHTLHVWCNLLQKPYDKVRYQIKYKHKSFEEAIQMF